MYCSEKRFFNLKCALIWNIRPKPSTLATRLWRTAGGAGFVLVRCIRVCCIIQIPSSIYCSISRKYTAYMAPYSVVHCCIERQTCKPPFIAALSGKVGEKVYLCSDKWFNSMYSDKRATVTPCQIFERAAKYLNQSTKPPTPIPTPTPHTLPTPATSIGARLANIQPLAITLKPVKRARFHSDASSTGSRDWSQN